MNLKASVQFKNIVNTKTLLKQMDKKRRTSGEKAVREIGKENVKLLRTEIKSGSVGGSKFETLKNLSRFQIKGGVRGPKRNKPMFQFAKHVRMYAFKKNKILTVWIGFVRGRGRGGQGMINLAGILQEGQTTRISEKRRRFFAVVGHELTLQGKKRMAKFFFLKKSTKQFKTPAREIIDPFWERYHGDMRKKVKAKYARLLKA